MKLHLKTLLAALTCAITLAAGTTANAQATRYWDSNGTTGGFGDTNGTWGTSAFWSTSNVGTATPTNATTATNDTLHFGTAANAYGTATRTVTVSGTQNAGTIIFGNGNTATTNLSGGVLNFGTNAVITNNSGTTSSTAAHIISSQITGFTTLPSTALLQMDRVLSYTVTLTPSAGRAPSPLHPRFVSTKAPPKPMVRVLPTKSTEDSGLDMVP